MKGVYDRATVHAAALRAVIYWKEAFEEEKAKWISKVANREHGFFVRRPIGRELAEKCFEANGMSGLPAFEYGGAFWWESRALEIAERLTRLTDRVGARRVILDQGEIAALRPVMERAS